MLETKTFHIGDILSITTGRLVSPKHIGGVYEICDWMTGQANFTHQLPRVSREIEPQLREDFPDLAAIEPPDGIDSMETLTAWLDSLGLGETREVERLRNPADHTPIDPISELKMMRPDATIIAVTDTKEN